MRRHSYVHLILCHSCPLFFKVTRERPLYAYGHPCSFVTPDTKTRSLHPTERVVINLFCRDDALQSWSNYCTDRKGPPTPFAPAQKFSWSVSVLCSESKHRPDWGGLGIGEFEICSYQDDDYRSTVTLKG